MDLMENIKKFLESEEIKNLFEINGYNTMVIDNEIYLENKNKKTTEKMDILGDENNQNRIRIKGTNFAFSINVDENENLYLDHLLIGDVEQDEYDFIMRSEFIDGKNKITVKLVDDKNVKHIYKIREDSINIERQSIKDKAPKYQNKNYDIKDYAKQKDEYKHNHFYIFKDKDGNVKLSNQSQEFANNCLREFVILEKTYISITPYIEKRIPFLSSCINEASYLNVTPYEIKRTTEEPYKPFNKEIIKEETKIYKFTKNKNN